MQRAKGDVVSFCQGGDFGHWIEARIPSAQTVSRYYYNVIVLDTGEETTVCGLQSSIKIFWGTCVSIFKRGGAMVDP